MDYVIVLGVLLAPVLYMGYMMMTFLWMKWRAKKAQEAVRRDAAMYFSHNGTLPLYRDYLYLAREEIRRRQTTDRTIE